MTNDSFPCRSAGRDRGPPESRQREEERIHLRATPAVDAAERLGRGRQVTSLTAPSDGVHCRDYVRVSSFYSGPVFKQEWGFVDLRTVVHATNLLTVAQDLVVRDRLVTGVGGLPRQFDDAPPAGRVLRERHFPRRGQIPVWQLEVVGLTVLYGGRGLLDSAAIGNRQASSKSTSASIPIFGD